MINVHELRLGNWFINQYGEQDQVESIQEGGPNDWYDDGSEPIHITEEVLLKCGAVRLLEKRFPSFNLAGMQINFINDKWIDYVTRIEITGLHHLQNVFYFTRNKELTYTP